METEVFFVDSNAVKRFIIHVKDPSYTLINNIWNLDFDTVFSSVKYIQSCLASKQRMEMPIPVVAKLTVC